MRRFAACFSTAQGQRGLPTSCVPQFCDGLAPARTQQTHDGIFVPDSDIDADPTDGPGDDLDGELLSPLERSWPREPETWGRRSVISPHRALVAAPDDDTAPGSDRGKSHGSPGAPTRALPPERRSSSDEDTPADGATRSVGSDLTRSSSSSSEEDDDAVTPLKLTTPTKSCLRPQSSCSSLDSESEIEAFEETQKSLRRAEDPRRVRFRDKTLDAVVTIPNLEDYGWRARRDCYWQPEEYAQMARSRVRLERAVLETGGRAVIPGESRRGLGLVCEPETRLARASKIQQTARAVLRMHANGATPGRLARFATDASRWATRNALICAEKDLAAAQDALRDASWTRRAPSPPPSQSYVVSTPVDMPRCDSNTASTDGLASMIRHDSLNDLTDLDRHVHDGSPLSFSEYQTSETRRRIAPATPSPPCAVRSAA